MQSNPERLNWLEDIDATSRAGVDPALFQNVREAYNSPGRHYHAWSHIEACLALYRTMQFDNPRAVFLALLFHDAIYVTGRSDNEAESAAFAERALAQWSAVPVTETNDIAQMIKLTASHHVAGAPTSDALKMLDIDLAILGADWPVYAAYASGVRREYCPQIVSEFKFCIGRLKFLRSVKKQPHIFLTEEMRARREQTARGNIAREIAELEREVGILGRVIAKFV